MSKFFVSWTVVGLIAISGLAFTLIAIVIARSPYTHGNLSPQGYDRTEIAYVGEEAPFDGLGLADPQLARTGDPVQDGRALFFQYGCTSCHGFQGQGGTLGADLDEASPSEIRREVRKGPEGMPAYVSSFLSDDDLEKIIAFLTSPAEEAAGETGAAASDGDGTEVKGGGFLRKVIAFVTRVTGESSQETAGGTSHKASGPGKGQIGTEER